ncbi:MAG: epoxyqueuosine reductase [Rhodospirillales bacterium]|nr:epoxyqueuosine reductase [Rhodospirillales bacterium]
MELSRSTLDFTLIEGAAKAGIVGTEALDGGPPSADLTYVLEGAKSAVSFAVAMDPDSISPYLMKQDRERLEKEMIRANVTASGIALHLSNYLINKGYKSVPVAANLVYRRPEGGDAAYDPMEPVYPDIAHRYLAAQSGLGFMGMSGNLITPEYGATVILAAVVTKAELVATPPLPPEENYCDDCRLCLASCTSRFMDFENKTRVNLGDAEVTYSERRSLARCDLVCSGYTGLAPNGRWSTWSPGRFEIPRDDKDIPAAYEKITEAYAKWPQAPGGRTFFYTDEKLRMTCGNCQLICAADPEERKRRLKMLKNSGVILQNEDGGLEAVGPNEAEQRLKHMPPARRALYED